LRPIVIASGKKYGELTVVREVAFIGKRKFLCECLCGNKVEVRLDHLQSGHTSSCGNCGVEYNGMRMSIKDWAMSHKIKESTLRARLKTMGMREALERK
jgi:transcription elongation factor Elf1